ncbi:MAG: phosphatase PAP2 family protein [Parachlamydiales bacterium]|jgi:membrane-associated PAP2 superfamily phosphatase
MLLAIRKHGRWLIPLLLFIAYTPWSGEIDLALTKQFYNHDGVGDNRFMQSPWILFVFNWGVMSGWLVIAFCFIFLLYSYITKKCLEWRKAAWVPILVLAIGSGLIVHAVLKDNWGRPRPKQVIEFGGNQEFRPYYKPYFNNPQISKSFACGHCSIGFFFFAVALIGERMRRRKLEIFGYVAALAAGGVLSYIRIAQGGHFFSDVVVSALIMWFTSLIICWLVFRQKEELCTD